MPALVLDWEVAGDVQLRRALPALAVAVEDAREPLRRAGDDVIYPATRRQFATEGAPAWPALDPAYAARKARAVGNAKILHYTGDLEASLTEKTDPQALYRLERLRLEIGSVLLVGDYNLALIHYAPNPEGPLPARKMMRLSPGDQSHIVTIFDEWLQREMRERGILL